MKQMSAELGFRVEADGLGIPSAPPFANKEDERATGKRKLAAAYRISAHYGLAYGEGGHITYRDPILPDHFWLNPLVWISAASACRTWFWCATTAQWRRGAA